MREFHINKNDADQRVDKFLMKTLPALPKSLMYKSIRNKKIKVNRKRCEISQRLQEGDTMQCFLAEEFFCDHKELSFLQVPAALDIVYEDAQIIIVNKEAGILVQKDIAGVQDNMNDRLLHYLYNRHCYDPETELSFTPSFAHRLDRNTEGLLIGGKTAEALRILNEKLRTYELEKYYLCLVEGTLLEKQGDLRYYHHKQDHNNKAILSTTEKAGTTLIHTSYRVLSEAAECSLLEVQLHTGKSHQIRATFAQLNHPLVGDVKYGAKPQAGFTYQALCAYKLKCAFQTDAGCLNGLKNKEFLLKQGRLLQFIREQGIA